MAANVAIAAAAIATTILVGTIFCGLTPSAKASGRLKTTSVMQTLSGFTGRLSQGESDFTHPPGGSSEATLIVAFGQQHDCEKRNFKTDALGCDFQGVWC